MIFKVMYSERYHESHCLVLIMACGYIRCYHWGSGLSIHENSLEDFCNFWLGSKYFKIKTSEIHKVSQSL